MQTESGEFAAAHDAFRRSLEIEPGSETALFNLGSLQLIEGNAAGALTTFSQPATGNLRLAGVAMAEHTLGHSKAAQVALDQLIVDRAQYAAYQVAEVYAWRGESDQAFQWLNRAYEQHDGGLTDVKNDPTLRPLRGDARFSALLKAELATLTMTAMQTGAEG